MDRKQLAKLDVHETFIKLIHQMESHEARRNETVLAFFGEELQGNQSMTLTGIHVLSCIGEHEPINQTGIAEKVEVSKGNLSKICTKLEKNGLVRKTQLNDNRKELFYRLTPKGKRMFDLHEIGHRMVQDHFLDFLDRYSESELATAKRFLMDVIGYCLEIEGVDWYESLKLD
jgi:DNA-binding MarR family transcriptional regulator